MSNAKDRKDFNKLNLNRGIEEKPAARGRGRPKGAKDKRPRMRKSLGVIAHEAKHKQPKADKITQGAEAPKPVETRRDKVVQEMQHAYWKLPVIQSKAEVSIKGEINANDIQGILRERPPYGMTIDYIVPEPLAMLFATDYVMVPEYAFDRFKGSRLIAFRLMHKSHVDTKDLDPIWFSINTKELNTQ